MRWQVVSALCSLILCKLAYFGAVGKAHFQVASPTGVAKDPSVVCPFAILKQDQQLDIEAWHIRLGLAHLCFKMRNLWTMAQGQLSCHFVRSTEPHLSRREGLTVRPDHHSCCHLGLNVVLNESDCALSLLNAGMHYIVINGFVLERQVTALWQLFLHPLDVRFFSPYCVKLPLSWRWRNGGHALWRSAAAPLSSVLRLCLEDAALPLSLAAAPWLLGS